MSKYHSSGKSSSGIGILGVLQIIFIVLKLTNLISWSWPVVLIPLWISIALFLIGFGIVIIFGAKWIRNNKHLY